MNFMDWLVANPVAFGALLGAGGSVLAQLIGAVVSSLAANRRAKQDRADRALDRSAAERERFDAVRREAFVEILQRSSTIAFALADGPGARNLHDLEGDLEQLAQRIEIVGLLAPVAYPSCVAVHRELAITRDQLANGEALDNPGEWWGNFRTAFVEPMRAAMRRVLGPAIGVPGEVVRA